VVVTDEAGDDLEGLEPAIAVCRRSGVQVYVVGPEAPIGQIKLPSTAENAPLTAGLESAAPEVLPLGYLDGSGDEHVGSGFGPWALTRLCRETGGVFFVESPQSGYRATIVQRFAPDYVSAAEYKRQAEANKSRLALLSAVQRCAADKPALPALRFSGDAEMVSAAMLAAQKAAAKLDALLVELNVLLDQGEADRQSESSPRWQAEFDLARGRVLALQARLAGLQRTLAEQRAAETLAGGTWQMVPAELLDGVEPSEPMQRGRTYLRRVVETHEGTPWALLAKRELDQPEGWAWQAAAP
jgi:hypothetical protein